MTMAFGVLVGFLVGVTLTFVVYMGIDLIEVRFKK